MQNQIQEYINDNRDLLEGVPDSIVEQIFNAGLVYERNNTLDLIANGTLTVHP